jgi:hypothetical protein
MLARTYRRVAYCCWETNSFIEGNAEEAKAEVAREEFAHLIRSEAPVTQVQMGCQNRA